MSDRPEPPRPENVRETVFLGEFGVFEAHLVIELLAEHGIFAVPKSPLGDTAMFSYEVTRPGHPQAVLVDKARLDDARKLITETLPARLREIEAEMEAMSAAGATEEAAEPSVIEEVGAAEGEESETDDEARPFGERLRSMIERLGKHEPQPGTGNGPLRDPPPPEGPESTAP